MTLFILTCIAWAVLVVGTFYFGWQFWGNWRYWLPYRNLRVISDAKTEALRKQIAANPHAVTSYAVREAVKQRRKSIMDDWVWSGRLVNTVHWLVFIWLATIGLTATVWASSWAIVQAYLWLLAGILASVPIIAMISATVSKSLAGWAMNILGVWAEKKQLKTFK